MTPQQELIKEIEKLEKIGKKRYRSVKNGKLVSRWYRNPKGIMTKKDVLSTINKFLKGYKLMKVKGNRRSGE